MEFIRGNQKNYIRVCVENMTEMETHEYQMCFYNNIPYLLSFQQRRENGQRYLYYEISGMQSLDIYLQTQKFKRDFAVKFSQSIRKLCEAVAEYALEIGQVVFLPKYIMITPEQEELMFLYAVSEKQDGKEQLERLLELCVERLDYEDERLMESLFGMYEKLENQKENFVLQMEMQQFYEALQEDKKESAETIETTDIWTQQIDLVSEEVAEIPDTVFEKELGGLKKLHSILQEIPRKKELAGLLLLDILLLLLWRPFTLVKLFFALAAGITIGYVQIQLVRKERMQKEQQRQQEAVLLQEYEYLSTRQKEPIEGTQLIQIQDLEGMLYNVHDLEPKYIPIRTDEMIIGTDKTKAQIQLDQKGISRMHALVVKQGSECFVEDLNSTNGTRINGEVLKPRTRYVLKAGDRVSFAGVEYIFAS